MEQLNQGLFPLPEQKTVSPSVYDKLPSFDQLSIDSKLLVPAYIAYKLRNLNSKEGISRRGFFRGISNTLKEVSALAVASNVAFPTSKAYAQELKYVVSPELPPSSPNWFPFDQGIADIEKIPTLQEKNGPLDKFDKAYGIVCGKPSYAREKWESIIGEFMAEHKGDEAYRASAGGCYGLAIAQALEPENFLKEDTDFIYRNTKLFPVRKSDKEGLTVAKYNPAATLPVKDLDQLVQEISSGRMVIMDIPEKGGTWFRTVYGLTITPEGTIDKVFATNFKPPRYKEFPFSQVKTLGIPAREDSRLTGLPADYLKYLKRYENEELLKPGSEVVMDFLLNGQNSFYMCRNEALRGIRAVEGCLTNY